MIFKGSSCRLRLSQPHSTSFHACFCRSRRVSLVTSWTPSVASTRTALPRKIKRIVRASHTRALATSQAIETPVRAARLREKPRPLLPASPEQQFAIDTLLYTKNNIIIDACAGSGKTTTILHLAKAAPGTNFLVLAYNKRTIQELGERARDLGLTNITVFTHNALGVRYYTPECATDQGLKRVVEQDLPVQAGMVLPDFSVLVMDEQQDMTPIMKRFVDKVLRDKGFIAPDRTPRKGREPCRIVCLGDGRQELYGFNNADSRFLTMAWRSGVFGYVNDHGWTWAAQTVSNRVTQQIVQLINQQVLKWPLGFEMRAVKQRDEHGVDFPKPRYVICDPRKDVLGEILRLLNVCGLKPADIMVLAPSVRGLSPAKSLANELALQEIPVFRSDSDVSGIAPEVANGKVLICTYHQAKGIERKACVVLGFDQSYHTLYDKVAEPPSAASNPQYVAVTRALEHLILIHDHKYRPLPFVDLETVGQTCQLVSARPLEIDTEPATDSRGSFQNVTNLCRNLSETLITACLERLKVTAVQDPALGVQPPPETQIRDKYGLLEDVSSITGTAVPAIYEWRQKGDVTILHKLEKYLKAPKKVPGKELHPIYRLPKMYLDRLREIKTACEEGRMTTEDILYVANMAMADISGDITKILAIPLDAYKWFSEAHSKDVHYTLNSVREPAKMLGRWTVFEFNGKKEFMDITQGGGPTNPVKQAGVTILGVMDIYCPRSKNKTVWEVKYTDSLHPEHLLQVALYMLLPKEAASGFLVSARTGQTVQVSPRDPGSLKEILQLLVDAKSGGKQNRLLNTYSDDEFLAECGRDFAGLVGKCALPAWFAMRPSGRKFGKSAAPGARPRRESQKGTKKKKPA